MKRALQRLLLSSYRVVLRSGLLSTSWGRSGFEFFYDRYKSLIEAGDVRALASFVQPGAWVIDVGANIGFFTRHFARWVRDGGRVLAIEPEEQNFNRLNLRLRAEGLETVVEPIQAVAAETGGELRLQINPVHPADHRIASEGSPVRAVSLDELMAERRWPAVSLIKIDVQGAEERVLRGAFKTLQTWRPALYMEVDDGALRSMESSAERVLKLLQEAGYECHRLGKAAATRLDDPDVKAACADGSYCDFLFLPRPAS